MITDRNLFPRYNETYDALLAECNLHEEWIRRADLIKNVCEKYYADYDLGVLVSEKKQIPLLYNRLDWGISYLFSWKLIEKVGYWVYKITPQWLAQLGQNAPKIPHKNTQEETPQDTLIRAYNEIEWVKKKDLLEYLKDINPYTFERVVWALCEAMWYWRFLETAKSHDWWIDWIVEWDALWFEKIYIQAKRYWDGNPVQWKEMQNFVWALAQTNAKRWVFFTTSSFSDNAKKVSNNASKGLQEIVLVDGDKLVDLMFQYKVWVQVWETYEIKYIDTDFFEGLN